MPTDSLIHGHLTDADIAAIVYAGLGDTITLVNDTRQPHLATCKVCQVRVDEAQRLDAEAAHLLQALDFTAPKLEVTEVMRRAQRRRWSAKRMARYPAVAASFLVCILGAVAFALPTSSLGRVLQHLIRIDRTAPHQAANAAVWSGVTSQQTSGIALNPTGPLTIEFRGGMPSQLQVQYCDTSLATLHVVPQPTPIDSGMLPDQNRVRFTISNNRIRVTTSNVRNAFVLTLPERTQQAYVTDDAFHRAISIGPPPSDHIAHGCHAPITVLLSREHTYPLP